MIQVRFDSPSTVNRLPKFRSNSFKLGWHHHFSDFTYVGSAKWHKHRGFRSFRHAQSDECVTSGHVCALGTVKNAMKTLAWTQKKRCVFDNTETEHLQNVLVWTGSKILFCKFAAGLLSPSDAEFTIVHMLYNKYILRNVLVYSIAVNFLSCAVF